VHDLRSVLVEVVRTSTADVDRRTSKRHPSSQEVSIRFGGKASKARLENISERGAMLVSSDNIASGTKIEVELPGINSPVRAIVRNVSDDGISVEFEGTKLDDAQIKRLSR